MKFSGLVGKKIVHVALGALHCLAVTDKGEVWAWGDNDHGQQGNSTTVVNRFVIMKYNVYRAREGHRRELQTNFDCNLFLSRQKTLFSQRSRGVSDRARCLWILSFNRMDGELR